MNKLDDLNKLDKFLVNLGKSRMTYRRKLEVIKETMSPLMDFDKCGSNLDVEALQLKCDELFDNMDAYEVSEWLKKSRGEK